MSPQLIGVSPSSVRAGETVELRGSGFGELQTAQSRVWLTPADGEPALDLSDALVDWHVEWHDDRIAFELPRNIRAHLYAVHVDVDGLASNFIDLEVRPPQRPVLTALVPPSAEPGSIVTLLGSNFGPESGRVVSSPDTPAMILSWSDAEIIITMPDDRTTDAVRVETFEGSMSEWFPITPTAVEPTLSAIQTSIFTPSCAQSGCHGSFPSEGLSLLEGESFASLVGVVSSQLPDMLRVDPLSPETSFLVDKLIHDPPAVGERMPRGSAPLLAEQVQMIEAWIRAGALDDR